MEFDWKKIRTEYITTNISYRKLCEKYNVSFTALTVRARKEKWVDSKRKYNDKLVTKSVDKIAGKAIDYKSDLYALAHKVATQLISLTDEHSLTDLLAMGIKPKDITGAIKDLEDALHVKSDADLREQEARIKNLQKQAESDDVKEISVTISDNANKYSK